MGKDSPEESDDEYIDYMIEPEEFKEKITLLLKDYVGVKKQALELGYKDDALKLKDYIDYYVRLNESK